MSREIKFRVCRKEKDGWRIYAESSIIDLWNGSNPNFGVMQKELTAYENGELIFLQYTGLKDKNGKEIYEGDIILVNYSGHKMEETVIFYLGGFKKCYRESDNENHYLPFTSLSSNNIEIIGNIYENPELIK